MSKGKFFGASRYLIAVLMGSALLAGPTRAEPLTIRIGVQKYGTLEILESQKTLDARLKDQGITVSWTEFPAGPQLLEALSAGSVDFGTTGDAPPVFAQAGHKALVYVGVEAAAPKGEAILVPKDSPIKTVADLKGKKVALNKGANVHYLLVRALESAGLKPSDIEPVYLAPADARAAFETNNVDAWAIWDPYLAAAQAATGATQLVNGVGLVENHQFYFATPDFAKAHPDLVEIILEETDKADHWGAAHQKEAAALLSPITSIPEPVLTVALARLPYGLTPLDDALIAQQQKIADTFHDLGLIPKPITVKDIVWTPHS